MIIKDETTKVVVRRQIEGNLLTNVQIITFIGDVPDFMDIASNYTIANNVDQIAFEKGLELNTRNTHYERGSVFVNTWE